MYFYPFPNLSSNFWLSASASVRSKWIRVNLVLAGEDGGSHFYLLKRDEIDIQGEIGSELEWRENPGRKEKHIRLFYDADPEDRQDWNRQHEWLCEQLETFHRIFSPRVEVLDASDYLPEEDETDE